MPRYSITSRRAFGTTPAVYQFIIDSPIYVGSTHNLQRRIDEHVRRLRANTHYCTALQERWNSGEAIDVVILESPSSSISRADLHLLEQAHIIDNRLVLANVRNASQLPTAGWEQRIEGLFPDM
jgi:hypothetical protein